MRLSLVIRARLAATMFAGWRKRGGAAAPKNIPAMSQAPWHPENLAARMPFLRRRGLVTAASPAFFTGRGYVEIETPYAVPAPGEEVHLRAFRTEREHPDGRLQSLWLHTSPEFAMKKLLVAGAG